MRFLTPEEARLLSSLPGDERAVLQAFFEECDARLVTEGDQRRGERIPVLAPGPAVSPSATSQAALFPMHKKEAA